MEQHFNVVFYLAVCWPLMAWTECYTHQSHFHLNFFNSSRLCFSRVKKNNNNINNIGAISWQELLQWRQRMVHVSYVDIGMYMYVCWLMPVLSCKSCRCHCTYRCWWSLSTVQNPMQQYTSRLVCTVSSSVAQYTVFVLHPLSFKRIIM